MQGKSFLLLSVRRKGSIYRLDPAETRINSGNRPALTFPQTETKGRNRKWEINMGNAEMGVNEAFNFDLLLHDRYL